MLALTLDLGGTHIGAAVVRDRALLASSSLDCEGSRSLESMLPAIADQFERLVSEAGENMTRCEGLAIGFPGIVDAQTGEILSTLKKYEDAGRLDLAGWARKTFGARLRIENDARMALLGEQYAGAGRDVQNVVMMTLGTGIGTGVMIEGKLLRGAHFQAGCLGGHLTVAFSGRACSCGNIGCAEAEAGGWSLPGILREAPEFTSSSLRDAPKLDFRALFAAAGQGDRVAREIQERCLNVWAANVVSLIHAYDPELVIIGGGVMRSGDVILPWIREYTGKHSWTVRGAPRTVAAELGESAGFLGAVPLLEGA